MAQAMESASVTRFSKFFIERSFLFFSSFITASSWPETESESTPGALNARFYRDRLSAGAARHLAVARDRQSRSRAAAVAGFRYVRRAIRRFASSA
jgi:hypothetical protein